MTEELPEPEPISQSAMEGLVQDALDDPRRGDCFHDNYQWGVEVLAVTDSKVSWRKFTAVATLDIGTDFRHDWAKKFRHPTQPGVPVEHTLRLQRRGAVDGSGGTRVE